MITTFLGSEMKRILLLTPILLLAASDVHGERGIEPTTFSEMQTERRVALVIGNAAYEHAGALRNPARDARAVAQAVSAVGFELVGGGALTDLDEDGMVTAISDFAAALDGGVGFFYYSGHGAQHDGRNYLIPVDANPSTPKLLKAQSLDVNADLLNDLEVAGSRLNIVVLDACRNNPWESQWFKDIGAPSGLANMLIPSGFLIAYATQPGDVALDGSGNLGHYAAALVQEMQSPQGLDEVFGGVHEYVLRETGEEQIPWTARITGKGDFYFTLPEALVESRSVDVELALVTIQVEYGGEVFVDGISAGTAVGDFGMLELKVAPGDRELRVGNEVWRGRLRPGQVERLEFVGDRPAGHFGREQSSLAWGDYAASWIPGHSFIMGREVRHDDQPVREVKLSGYWMGTYEVTQGQYEAVMGENPSVVEDEGVGLLGSELPVQNVRWCDAVAFANRLSEKDKLTPVYSNLTHCRSGGAVDWDRSANGWRLPTEAEWESAASQDRRTWSGIGDRSLCSYANIADASMKAVFNWSDADDFCDDGYAGLAPVGSLKPNERGLYDMLGNVREWVWDWYQNNYEGRASIDPAGPESGSSRVHRGGSWADAPSDAQVPVRLKSDPAYRLSFLGLRLARSP